MKANRGVRETLLRQFARSNRVGQWNRTGGPREDILCRPTRFHSALAAKRCLFLSAPLPFTMVPPSTPTKNSTPYYTKRQSEVRPRSLSIAPPAPLLPFCPVYRPTLPRVPARFPGHIPPARRTTMRYITAKQPFPLLTPSFSDSRLRSVGTTNSSAR